MSETPQPKLVFVTGGARSGKSSFALNEASSMPGPKAYIATAEPLDGEMAERIRRHREERGSGWDTLEEPVELAALLRSVKDRYSVLLVDCLTLWLSNIYIVDRAGVEREIEGLVRVLKELRGSPGCPSLYLVSNEVGMGIVPENRLARVFRDMAGRLNQEVAGVADEVYLVVSGIPLKVKG
ncbi:MAG TPA: bifunctional adenosylcobinamide kinase/adenosylcobinamide-phosphate guanylyltransferase [Nitrospirae bacterium]|nr:bifunctional adenosylcobinamide kinase/adenosylcobinamide-phosphate guanylyltransferase [Nitrospirota bacterium]